MAVNESIPVRAWRNATAATAYVRSVGVAPACRELANRTAKCFNAAVPTVLDKGMGLAAVTAFGASMIGFTPLYTGILGVTMALALAGKRVNERSKNSAAAAPAAAVAAPAAAAAAPAAAAAAPAAAAAAPAAAAAAPAAAAAAPAAAFNALLAFSPYADALKMDKETRVQSIAEVPPTIKMANENGVVAASLQAMLTPPYMKRLPGAIERCLKEVDLFPDGVKEVYKQNPGLGIDKQRALVKIGRILRSENGTINEINLNALRLNLKILGNPSTDPANNGLPTKGLNKNKINKLLVLLEFRQCFRNPHIPASAVADLYESLIRLNGAKFPVEMGRCSPLTLCQTISVLMEEHPTNEASHVVRFIVKPRPGDSERYFLYEPEQIVVSMVYGPTSDIKPTTDVFTAADGSKTTYRADSYISWENGRTHATATVARAKGIYKTLNWNGKNDTWTNCDNSRREQNRECPLSNPQHLAHAYLVFTRKA